MNITLKKKVNVFPIRGPITNVNPPIRVPVKNILLPIADIRKCIVAGAKVEEILTDKKTIVLNLQNYDQDNGGAIVEVKDTQPAVLPKPTVKPSSAISINGSRKMSKVEMKNVKEKFMKNNSSLKAELSRTADEADEANKKIAEEAKQPVEETKEAPVVEEKKEQQHQPYMTRRQLRKLKEQQMQKEQAEKEAAEATQQAPTTLAEELEAVNVDDVIETVDPEKL